LGHQVYYALIRPGFKESNRKGSYVKMVHNDGRIIVFPYHPEIDRYTLNVALKDANIDIEDFLNKVK